MRCWWHCNVIIKGYVESVSSAEVEGSSELAQTNKNLTAAMEKLEARCRLLEDKSEKLKRFKNIVRFWVILGQELCGFAVPALFEMDSEYYFPTAFGHMCRE